jgi:hypothetical protein
MSYTSNNGSVAPESNGSKFSKFNVDLDGMNLMLSLGAHLQVTHPKKALKILLSKTVMFSPVNENNGMSLSVPVSVISSNDEQTAQRYRNIGFINPLDSDDYIDEDTSFDNAEVYTKDDVDLASII